MCKQILLTSTMRNIWRTVRRICVLILGLKGSKGVRKQGSDKEAKVQVQHCADNFC